MRLLVAEDERDLNRLLQKVLTKAGYTVDGCYDGEEALLYLQGTAYDALVLDVMMPRKDGYTLVQEMRSQGMDTPVLFLTARDSVADRVKGLDLGADDYLVKPFDFDELLARLRAMTRKHVGQRTNTLTVGDLTLDTAQRRVTRDGEEIALLPKEAVVVNVGRGTAIDQDALMQALNAGRLAGAALDVVRPEPLPPEHPLWNTKNLLLTPHLSGFMSLGITRDTAVALFCEDFENYIAGRPLKRLVDRRKGY